MSTPTKYRVELGPDDRSTHVFNGAGEEITDQVVSLNVNMTPEGLQVKMQITAVVELLGKPSGQIIQSVSKPIIVAP